MYVYADDNGREGHEEEDHALALPYLYIYIYTYTCMFLSFSCVVSIYNFVSSLYYPK